MELSHHLIDSPVGKLLISGTAEMIHAVIFMDEGDPIPAITPEVPVLLLTCEKQLREYFAGTRRDFDLPVSQEGTPFQQRVWDQLLLIPYGRTISYMQLAKRLNNPKSIRAVGTTNGKNMLVIIVPCHRVIGSNGTLVGFGGGLWRKRWLLEHEKKVAFGQQELFS